MRFVRLLCILLIACFPIPAGAKSLTVPLRFYGTRPAVEVMVNGQGPFLFLVDTGAGGPPARADASLVQRLGLAKQGQTTASDGKRAAVPIDEVTLPSVTLGTWSVGNIAALSRDYNSSPYMPKLDGILGLAFFRGRLLTIDYVHGTLTVEDGELPRADARSILDYDLIEDGIWIPVSIGDQSAKAVLDTGNIRALDIPSEAVKSLRMATFARPAGTSTSVSGSTPIREVTLAAPMRIGSYLLEKPAVTFSEDFQDWNIGSSLLQDFVVTIDQKNRRLRLLRQAGSKN